MQYHVADKGRASTLKPWNVILKRNGQAKEPLTSISWQELACSGNRDLPMSPFTVSFILTFHLWIHEKSLCKPATDRTIRLTLAPHNLYEWLCASEADCFSWSSKVPNLFSVKKIFGVPHSNPTIPRLYVPLSDSKVCQYKTLTRFNYKYSPTHLVWTQTMSENQTSFYM